MAKRDLNEKRKQLYKVSDNILSLVDRVKDTLVHLYNGVEVNGIRLDSNQLKIGDLNVAMIEVDPQDIGCILIHWQPNFNISTHSDPYCSIYMLEEKEIKDVWRYLKKVQAYAVAHNTHPQ